MNDRDCYETPIKQTEAFKIIPLENNFHYYADVSGNIYSTKRKKIKKLSISTCQNNSSVISLNVTGGKRKSYQISCLVALTFIPNKNHKKMSVKHKNRNQIDNRVSNVFWIKPTCREEAGNRSRQLSRKKVRKLT